MDSKAFRKALDDLGMTQVEAAQVAGVNDRTVRRWALDEVLVPRYMEVILWFMWVTGKRPEDIPNYTNPGD